MYNIPNNNKNKSEKKVTLIADSIYNTIRISSIEKEIISNDVFNRLHNILQNSTAYLTYPSLKTSRFSHSLGVMHIAGMIFQQSIINARDDDRKIFFDSAKEIIEKSKDGDFTKKIINNYFNQGDLSCDLDECDRSLGESLNYDALYSNTTPSSFNSNEHHTYNIVYQAIRIAALLHDLGHPPFSHMVENVFSEISYYLETKKEINGELENEEQKIFYDTINNLVYRSNGKKKKVHEIVGNLLAEYVLEETLKNIQINDQHNFHQMIYDIAIINQIALGILNDGEIPDVFIDKKSFLISLHSIISSDMDADRLDYLERDLRSSSNRGHISYDRLLAGFCLISSESSEKNTGNKNQYNIEFIPSIQALSSIEEFFTKRFELYKFILFHHRVAKTDGLLTEAVSRLAFDFLESSRNVNNKKNKLNKETFNKLEEDNPPHFLTSDIYWLWKILSTKERRYNWNIAYKYFQWDDAWLLNCLRRKYISLKKIIIDTGKGTDYQKNEDLNKHDRFRVYPILEELLTNRKKFVSLYKRPIDFNEVDIAFIKTANKDKDFYWDSIKLEKSQYVKKLYKNILSYIDMCKSIIEENTDNISYPFPNTIEELRICRGYFINCILEYMISSQLWTNDIKKKFINKAIISIKQKKLSGLNEYDDIIPLFKVLKPGVSEDFHILVDGKVERLGKYSRIVHELSISSNLFPPFFVAIYTPGKELSSNDLINIKTSLGSALWTSFIDLV